MIWPNAKKKKKNGANKVFSLRNLNEKKKCRENLFLSNKNRIETRIRPGWLKFVMVISV